MFKQIRSLKENEYYLIEDDTPDFEFAKTAFSEQALEKILFDHYDSSEHWSLLIGRHPRGLISIINLDPLSQRRNFIKEMKGGD